MQILKDLPNRFDKSRAGYDPTRTRPPIPAEEVSDGHSHLTGEGLSESRYAKSRQLVENHLNSFPILKDFFHVDAGHSDLDHLEKKVKHDDRLLCQEIGAMNDQGATARQMVEHYESNMTEAMRLLRSLDNAIGTITLDLLDEDLWVKFPERIIRKTHRTQTMEENYREINRVFESWCEELSQQHKRYRNKALEATGTQLSVAKATVERAVRFSKDEKKED